MYRKRNDNEQVVFAYFALSIYESRFFARRSGNQGHTLRNTHTQNLSSFSFQSIWWFFNAESTRGDSPWRWIILKKIDPTKLSTRPQLYFFGDLVENVRFSFVKTNLRVVFTFFLSETGQICQLTKEEWTKPKKTKFSTFLFIDSWCLTLSRALSNVQRWTFFCCLCQRSPGCGFSPVDYVITVKYVEYNCSW